MADFRKILDQTPTNEELVKTQSVDVFKPTYGQVTGAFVEDAFQGIGTAYQGKTLYDVMQAKKTKNLLSEEKFNEKVGNTKIKYSPDMTEESFDTLKKYHDEQAARDFIMGRATNTQFVGGLLAGIVAGVAEPVNLATGLGVGAFVKSGFTSLAKSTGRVILSTNPMTRAAQVGLTTGLAETAVTTYPVMTISNRLQQEYTAGDALYNGIVSTVIGTGLDIGSTAYTARKARIKADKVQLQIKADNPLDFAIIDASKVHNLDADVLNGIIVADAGDNKLKIDETTGLYGFWGNKQDKATEYGITQQSTLQQQTQAFSQYTSDNVDRIEKALGRDINATETYLCNWLGADEAIEVLKAEPNASFAKTMRKNDYYKQDGLSNSKAFLKENGLPKNATMAEVINHAQTRISKGLGQSKYIPISTELIEKIDLKFNQGLSGQQVDLNALVATHIQRDFNNGLKFIDKFNAKSRSQIEALDKSFQNGFNAQGRAMQDDINYEDTLSHAENTMLALNKEKTENLENRLQSTKDKIEKFNLENNISPDIAPSVFEIEAEFYRAEFEDLRTVAKELDKTQKSLQEFKDYAPANFRGYELEEFHKIFKGKKLSKETIPPLWKTLKIDPDGELAKDLASQDITPKTAVGLFAKGGLRNADDVSVSDYRDYNLKDDGAGYADRDELIESIASSFGVRSRDLTQEDFIKETGLDPKTATKKQFLDYFENKKGNGLNTKPKGTIEINGVTRSTVNSKGQPIAQTEEGLKNFWNWFGDSKVVDDKGNPLVVYHGTAHGGFDEFDIYTAPHGLMGQGAYFTENPNVASEYTTKGKEKLEKKGKQANEVVMPVYLRIDNVLDMDAKADADKWLDNDFITQYMSKENFDNENINELTNESFFKELTEQIKEEGLPYDEGKEAVQYALTKMGYDGVTHIGGGRVDKDGVRHKVSIVFNPNQIKSIFNRGTFDPNNPKITDDGVAITPNEKSQYDYSIIEQSLSNAYIKDRDRFKTLKKEFDEKSKDLKRHALQVQNKAEQMYQESMKNQLDVFKNPVYDKPAMKAVDDINAMVENYKEDDDLMLFEQQVNEYQEKGLLDDEDIEALNSVGRYDDDDFLNMQEQTVTCLLTGGVNEA